MKNGYETLLVSPQDAIGERRAKEYVLTGKPFTAQQAEQWGLVNEKRTPDFKGC